MSEDPLYIGIDFGNSTNFVTKYDQETRRASAVKNLGSYTSSDLFPNCIYIESDGNDVLGEPADKKGCVDPNNFFNNIKRYIGSEAREWTVPHLDYRSYRASDLASRIFKSIKNKVENNENRKIKGVVLTVPYAYSDTYRNRLMEAAENANLTVIGIVEEPVAAALAYGLTTDMQREEGVEKNIMVFDFGGGTLDVTVFSMLDLKGGGIRIEVLNTDGEADLGGDSIDIILERKFEEEMEVSLSSIANKGEAIDFKHKLSYLATETKIALSFDDEVDVFEAFNVRGDTISFEKVITRSDFVLWMKNNNLIGKMMDAVERALFDIGEEGMEPDDIDKVLLVGGCSNIPVILESLQDFFGDICQLCECPEKLVGLGAGMMAGAIQKKEVNYELIRKVGKSIGIADGNKFKAVLPKNANYGVESQRYPVRISNAGGRQMLKIYEGDNPLIEKCDNIGKIFIDRGKILGDSCFLSLNKDEDGRVRFSIYDMSGDLKENDYIQQ